MTYLLNTTKQKISIVMKCVFIAGLITACNGSSSFGVSEDGETVVIDLESGGS